MNESEITEILPNEDKQNDKETIKRTADIEVAEDFTFSKFLLSDKLLKSLNKLNFIKPSPIQVKVIPLAKCGLDMIIQAKSGTGKTLAFGICLLESYDIELKFPQALVVVPTREIAVQIVSVLNDLGRNMKHFKACEFIGGTEITNDRKNIQSAKVVVGTPGRILHLIKNEIFNISNLKSLVLDEADKLLESGQMGKDVTSILKLMHRKIQIIATTATVTGHLEKVMKREMKNPIGITPKHEIPVLLGIKQFVKVLPRENDNIELMNVKVEELNKIFTRISFKQCLLFTDSQTKTESYGNYLTKRGWKNEVINGAQDQSQRLRVLDKLIKFKCRILITTDLMARGIDISNVNLIINLDLTHDCYTYLHRIGRAGRFGTQGIAITFVNGEEDLPKFQKILGDIGGKNLKALEFPDESFPYDFWNFDQKDENILKAISGFAKDGECDDNGNGEIITQNCDFNKEEEIVLNNLALLEITKKLIDDVTNDSTAFELSSMIADYESNSTEIEPEIKSANVNLQDDNIFLKTIEDLQLYNDDPSDKQQEVKTESSITAEESKEISRVIFKRPREVLSDESISDSEDEDYADEESGSEYGNETEGDEEEIPEPAKSFHPKKRSTQQSASNNSNLIQGQPSQYHQYVAANYSNWENIYQFQLANIQNFIQSSNRFN